MSISTNSLIKYVYCLIQYSLLLTGFSFISSSSSFAHPVSEAECVRAFRNRGIFGAWRVNTGYGTGILRMSGYSGTMTLATKNDFIELRMTLRSNPQGGYILYGRKILSSNGSRYTANNLYFQKFSDFIKANSCSNNGSSCHNVHLTYLGK